MCVVKALDSVYDINIKQYRRHPTAPRSVRIEFLIDKPVGVFVHMCAG